MIFSSKLEVFNSNSMTYKQDRLQMRIRTFKTDQICIKKMHFQPQLLQNTWLNTEGSRMSRQRTGDCRQRASGCRQHGWQPPPGPLVAVASFSRCFDDFKLRIWTGFRLDGLNDVFLGCHWQEMLHFFTPYTYKYPLHSSFSTRIILELKVSSKNSLSPLWSAFWSDSSGKRPKF